MKIRDLGDSCSTLACPVALKDDASPCGFQVSSFGSLLGNSFIFPFIYSFIQQRIITTCNMPGPILVARVITMLIF